MTDSDPTDVVVATVNAGGWELLYVNGELRLENDEISISDVSEVVDGPIGEVNEEWRIGDVQSYNAPETYEELCEITDE